MEYRVKGIPRQGSGPFASTWESGVPFRQHRDMLSSCYSNTQRPDDRNSRFQSDSIAGTLFGRDRKARIIMNPLANRTYRRLFAAQVIALAGTGLSTIALALLAYELAGGDAGTILGIALTLKMVAYVGIAPLVGGLAHRLPRKRLLIALDIGRAAAVGCLPFVTEVWQIYALIFILSACSAGFTPTFQATIPDVLPDEAEYTRALSLS